MSDDLDRYLAPEIERTLAALLSRHPAFLAHERFIRDRLAELSQRSAQHGAHVALASLRTSEDVAEDLGLTLRAVQALGRRYDLGWWTGRDRIYRPEDIEVLRNRRSPGRPKEGAT